MTVDNYAAAAAGWATGAELVYRPIARELVAMSPHSLAGHRVLDVGSGTGAATAALVDRGAKPIAVDLSPDMLSWDRAHRPPAAVGDVTNLPVRSAAVDDVIAAFVYNHLADPIIGFTEARRVTRRGGAVLACTFANIAQSTARDALDQAARDAGWRPPQWYVEAKTSVVHLLGSAPAMREIAAAAGLSDIVVEERPVEVGVGTPQQLVAYRLGQAHFAPWLAELGPDRAAELRSQLVETVTPVMAPYRPIVVFLSAFAP